MNCPAKYCVSLQDESSSPGMGFLRLFFARLESSTLRLTMALQDTSPTVADAVDNVVVSAKANDEQRRRIARIKRTIQRQTAGGVHQLKVEVTTDTVLLRGRCASFYCKQKAQHAAMNLLSGETLVNEIEVDVLPR